MSAQVQETQKASSAVEIKDPVIQAVLEEPVVEESLDLSIDSGLSAITASASSANGRKSTGFNLSSFKVKVVHYMRDWNLYIDAQGSMTTQYSGKYEWVPTVTVYVKWNAIPELKTQGAWDASNREWK